VLVSVDEHWVFHSAQTDAAAAVTAAAGFSTMVLWLGKLR